MKKLLATLTIISTFGSIMPMILANVPTKTENNNLQASNLESNKIETLSTNDYLEFNNKIIKKVDVLPEFEEVKESILNSYFIKDNNFYFLKQDNNIPEKINGIESPIDYWNKIIFNDKNNNVYFGTNDGLYTLKYGEIIASKLNITNGIYITFGITDNDGNIYIGTNTDYYYRSYIEKLFVIKNNNLLVEISDVRQTLLTYNSASNATKKVVIDNKNNAYVLGYGDYIYIIKSGETTATKIENIYLIDNGNANIVIDSNNNAYILTNNTLYVLKHKENIINKIIETKHETKGPLDLYINKNDNVYFKLKNEMFVLKSKKINAFEIIKAENFTDVIIRNNNFYFITNQKKAYILKKDDTMPIEINSNNKRVGQLFVDNNENIYIYADIINQGNFYLSIFKKNTNIPIRISGIIGPISYIFEDNNNNIYFGSGNGLYTLKSGETTATKIKIENSSQISLYVFDNNYNLYFGMDYSGVFVIKSGEITATKIEGINWRYGTYAEIYKDKKYDIIYFEINNALYKLNGGENKASKIFESEGEKPDLFTSDKDNTYYQNYGNNNIYFLKNGETTATKINNINEKVNEIVFNNKNNVYFVTNDSLYTLKSGETTATKINNINEKVNKIVVNNNNDIFLGTNNGAYILKSGEITATKINNINEKVNKIVVNNNNDIFLGTNNGAYILKSGEITATKINNINEKVNEIVFNNKNNVYFVTNDSLYTLKSGEITATKINNINEKVNKIVVNNNNDIFLGTNNGAYILKSGEITATKINNINEKVNEIINNENNTYIISSNGLYLSQNKLPFNQIININNLEKIESNNDETILNTLNYLNHENNYFLNLNKMKVVNKTPTSAIIMATKGKYRGEVTVNYKIKNQDEISAIDFNDLIKKAVYFNFFDKNYFSLTKLKEIKNINIDNLMFSAIEVTSASDSLKLIDEKSVCFKPINFPNTSSPGAQKIKVPSCSYETKAKYLFQITTGLKINNSKNIAKGWNLNIDDEMILTDFTSSNKKASEIKNTLSQDFDLSNTNKQEQELILNRDLLHSPEQELSVEPKQRLIAQYVIRLFAIKTNLDLKQKINGTITAKIIDDNNKEQTITLSITEAMQILKKYRLLPDEITINKDNSVTFNGKAIISRTSESDPQPIFNFRSI